MHFKLNFKAKRMLRFKFGLKTAQRTFQITLKRFAHSERKVLVGDKNINIVEVGNGKNNVLLMPGALGSACIDFKPQIEKLPALLLNYNFIAWDPVGYGKSRPPQRNFSVDSFKKDAETAMELMHKLNKPTFSILGWCEGGLTGIVMASRFPKNIQKLVIWGSNPFVVESDLIALEGLRDVSKWHPRMLQPLEQLYGIENFSKLWSDWTDAYAVNYEKNQGDNCRADVARIKAPTFILHGKKDPMITAEHVSYLRENIKNHKYFEFPDGRHNIHLRYADDFNTLVADFLLGKH